MHKYELSYEYAGKPITRSGEALDCIDGHSLLVDLLTADGYSVDLIVGTTSYQQTLELMRFKNVLVRWL